MSIRIIFIQCEDITQVSEIMSQAFEFCREHVQDVLWQKEHELNVEELSKTDSVVFERFEGAVYERVKSTKSARVLGPWCVDTCLRENKPIPNFPWPILNVAMYGAVVACSNIPKTKREEIKNLVGLMGGSFTADLTAQQTHLITNSVKSTKYLIAAEKGIKRMLPEWLHAVWEESQSANVHCNDQQFDQYRVPPFYKLTICTTGVSMDQQKIKIKKIVSANGGVLSPTLKVSTTDFLIVHGTQGSSSEKYKAARKRSSIICVTVDWLYDSAEKGYLLAPNDYLVKLATSTPTKSVCPIDPDFSTLSCIAGPSAFKSTLEATIDFQAPATPLPQQNEYVELLDQLDIKCAKKAGQFLDGCSVYFAGFVGEQREKLCKVLNFSGATRYDSLSHRLTHVIVGDLSCNEVKLILAKPICEIVGVDWLLECIEQKKPVSDEKFLISSTDLDRDSQICHKGLTLLRSEKTITEQEASKNTQKEAEMDDLTANKENEILQQYLKPALSQEEDTLMRLLKENPINHFETMGKESEMDESMNSQDGQSFFEGLTFIVTQFLDEEMAQSICEKIVGAKGRIKHKGTVQYIVVPVIVTDPVINATGEVVNDLFVAECLRDRGLVTVEHYHKPMVIKGYSKPLKHCVVAISVYTDFERTFLKTLIEALGGVYQEQLSRVSLKAKNVIASTHLMSPVSEGKKYVAALKWGLPVVSKDWVLECARTETFVSERDYLIGDSKASTPPSISNSTAMSHAQSTSFVQPQSSSQSPCTPDFGSTSQLLRNVRTPLNEDYLSLKTPDTPLGAFIDPDPSPRLRKRMLHYINQFPDFVPPRERRLSTPLSEIKRQLWAKIDKSLADSPVGSARFYESEQMEVETEKESENKSFDDVLMDCKLNEMENLMTDTVERRASRAFQASTSEQVGEIKDSQAFTVDWHYGEEIKPRSTVKKRIFMISGVDPDQRETLVTQLESLGGIVSSLSSYDPTSTHLISSKPGRTEKTLSSMASGTWILHHSYVEKSLAAGKFLDEELFEYGNPKSQGNVPFESNFTNMCYWRQEISKRGYGAFHMMRAIIVASKRETLARVIEAGGGKVLNFTPPFGDDIDITHCFLEPGAVGNSSDYVPLARRGVYCVNTMYIHEFLFRTHKDIKDCIVPLYVQYYEMNQL